MTKANGTHSITLSDERVVTVDADLIRKEIHTRKDFKRVGKLKAITDEYDEFLAQYTNLSVEELEALAMSDWNKVDEALGKVMQEMLSPK
jgi:hypothetical protein